MADTSAQVRSYLVEALRLDLVGPDPTNPRHQHEELPQAPASWYLSGFLVPFSAKPEQRSDDVGNDELDTISQHTAGDDEDEPESPSARRAFFPSSIGMSLLVPAGVARLEVAVSWGDYTPQEDLEEEAEAVSGTRWTTWRRSPHQETVQVVLHADQRTSIEVPYSRGLKLETSTRAVQGDDLVPLGTLAVSLFLVNRRREAPDLKRDAAFAFQVMLNVTSPKPLVPRPDVRGRDGGDWDDAVGDVQFRHDYEFAVGHNISVHAVESAPGLCQQVSTIWIPEAEVEKVVPRTLEGVNLNLEDLARAESAEAVRQMVGGMLTQYTAWIGDQAAIYPQHPERLKVAQQMMGHAERAARRIEEGLGCLEDPDVLNAFTTANRAVATALRQRWAQEQGKPPASFEPPVWRPFQLAFVFMNLAGIVNPKHQDREWVDLLFFPTGGGKTEAYLGLAAFTIVLRRLRAKGDIQGAGVSVIMRYTLRLLTLDQLGRAATLICALELERKNRVDELGTWPFEIGLWVGQTATPNRMGVKGDSDHYSARSRTIAYQNDDKHKPSPIPLESCPWCGTTFTRHSFQLRDRRGKTNTDEPRDLRVICGDRKAQCPFHAGNPLPIVAVDDPIYRRLPCFIIATVDKFAQIPWVGETGALFGKVDRYDPQDGFYGPATPGLGRPLEAHLPPPDLIIQDELHLISGPLGTMVGLFETAIDALCHRKDEDLTIRPKVVASTATVRRATKQIRGLFGRNDVDVFPPPGPDRRDSFFAKTVSADERNPRLYIGVAGQGRSLKVVLLRAALALMAAAEKQWRIAGGAKNDKNPADPYMTLLSYYNSLRELGGSRRIFEDEVTSRLAQYASRRRIGDTDPMFADRTISFEPHELTSRVSTNKVAETKRRLALFHGDKEHVDVALATNMISVGLDITRLGLMVVHGQPKTASEYIQATSRVGRDDQRSGLVVTLLNLHRPRDRSHYERFEAWHRTFYRAVEATSVTPFSPRAIDRGIAAVTVSLARHLNGAMTHAASAVEILNHRSSLDHLADIVAERGEAHDSDLSPEEQESLRHKLRGRVINLLDAWVNIADRKHEAGAGLQYASEVGKAPPLLYQPLDPELRKQPPPAEKFKAQRSLRDVEPSVNLWLCRPDGKPEGEDYQ